MRFSVARIVAVLSIAILVSVVWLWWSEIGKRFPRLSKGEYLGALGGVPSLGDGAPLLYVDWVSEDRVFVSVIAARSEARYVALVSSESGSPWMLPLLFSTPQVKLKLIGGEVGEGAFSGEVHDLTNHTTGQWLLTRLAPEKPVEGEVLDARVSLMLRQELDRVREESSRMESSLVSQRAAIERINKYVSDGQKLRANADEKYRAEVAKTQEMKARLKAKSEEVSRVRGQIDIAQRVTGMGRLVSLSRESLSKEAVWLDMKLGAALPEESPDMMEAIRRAEQIQELRRQIRIEEETIQALENPALAPVEASETLPGDQA